MDTLVRELIHNTEEMALYSVNLSDAYVRFLNTLDDPEEVTRNDWAADEMVYAAQHALHYANIVLTAITHLQTSAYIAGHTDGFWKCYQQTSVQ